MSHLRLRVPEERQADDPIPFPDLGRFARRDESRPGDLRLSARIDECFARVQADLDELDDEIGRVLQLPASGDDWPPSAA